MRIKQRVHIRENILYVCHGVIIKWVSVKRGPDGCGWRMRMADGGWRMADGGWRMADGGWRMADGGWENADGKMRMTK